jgi:hypothetical protein
LGIVPNGKLEHLQQRQCHSPHVGVKEQAFCYWSMQHFHPHVDNDGEQLKHHVVLQLVPASQGN